ncbi:unnamed protein product [Aphis gossypii]|uniref:Anaphase-promoting complex subunit CDC26 n=1 Tax=Aphis gossypii TaxID=80765 RepID=A0A9P0IZF4_APHGO|nr:unnamed protein product [Aphis gossypii]
MIRLNPTRIELRIEDLSEFADIKNHYETVKKNKEEKQKNLYGPLLNSNSKTKQEVVQERIGFIPRPRHSSS